MSRCPPLARGPKDSAETALLLENLTQSQDNFLSVLWAGSGGYFIRELFQSLTTEIDRGSFSLKLRFGYQVYKVNCPTPLLIMKMLNIFSCA